MHLVFLNQYYPPDAAPTGVMLETVVESLVAGGHEVTVICADGGYAGGEKLKAEIRKAEREEDGEKLNGEGKVGGGRLAVGTSEARDFSEVASGQQPTANGPPTPDCGPPRANRSPTILRIEATRFGRGTFVGKLLDYFSYYLGVSWKLARLKSRPDRIVALTTPPYLSVLARLISRFRSADHAHWVMDLYPDVMVAHGMLAGDSLKHRILSGLARWGFGGKRCASVLTLGPDMAERVAVLMGHDEKNEKDPSVVSSSSQNTAVCPIQWVPLWGSSDVTRNKGGKSLRSQRGWSENDLVVMYSGNMGLGHRFQEFLLAAKELAPAKDGRIRLVFFGEGKRRGEIESFIEKNPECAMELHGYAPSEILDAHLRSADVHLVSLEASWTGTMVPSKLQGIFAVARPVVFVGPAESSIGQWVEKSGGGWVVEPNHIDAMVAAIREAADQRNREKKGQAALEFARSHFDRSKNSREVAAFLTSANRSSTCSDPQTSATSDI